MLKKLISLVLILTLVVSMGSASAMKIMIKLTKPVYQRGSTGEDVEEIQKSLIELGYLAKGEADGIYGPLTARAVHLFKMNEYGSCDCESEEQCKINITQKNHLCYENCKFYTGTPVGSAKKSSSSSSAKKSGSSGGYKLKKCSKCGGSGYCRNCISHGCSICSYTGFCTRCWGSGRS